MRWCQISPRAFPLIVSAVIGLVMAACAPDVPFDSAQWKAAAGQDGSRARARMVEDLQTRILKKGMSHAEIEALLGEPDQRAGEEKGRVGSRFYSYGLGHHFSYRGDLGFGIYQNTLVVEFTPRGEVVRFSTFLRERQ